MGGKAAIALGLVTGAVGGRSARRAGWSSSRPGLPRPLPAPIAARRRRSRQLSRHPRPPHRRRQPPPRRRPPRSRRPRPAQAFGVGEPAPALVVPQVGGGTIDLATLKGKPVWINFMATWCPAVPGRAAADERVRGALRGRRGWSSIAVDVREDEARSRRSSTGSGSTLPGGPGHGRRRPGRRGAPSPCRSTSGSTRTASCVTARSAGSGRTSWRQGLQIDPAGRDRHAVGPRAGSARGESPASRIGLP